MEKRFFIACALSLLVLMLSTTFFKSTQPVSNKEVIKSSSVDSIEDNSRPPSVSTTSSDPLENNHNLLDNNNLYAYKTESKILTFSKLGGFLLDVFDQKVNTKAPFTKIGYIPKLGDCVFSVSELPKGIVLECVTKNGVKVKKSFRIKDDDVLELTVTIIDNINFNAGVYDIYVGYFDVNKEKDPLAKRYFESCALVDDKVTRKPVFKINRAMEFTGRIPWVGLRDRYGCVLFLSEPVANKAVIEQLSKGACLKIVMSERSTEQLGSQTEDRFTIYIGPQDIASLRSLGAGAEKIVNFGMFDSISRIILFLLSAIFKITKSWGLAIIFITILIYIVMSPLAIKSMLSMKKMQSLQPKIEQLKIKNKENPQKLNIEIMELYRREKVNPLGGCLPMVLQIPVFFALYQLLMRFNSLKGASFLWIKDLSEPDRLLIFQHNLPVIGNEFNLLPLLMSGGMFLQQKMSTASSDALGSEQQKMLTIVMPVVFCFLFYKLPAGLVLYWFINSMLMFLFQWKILRKNT